jgi:hypothetical protein
MKYIKLRKKTFKSEKNLPNSTFLILTKNNEEELQSILHHLTTHPLFLSEFGQVIVVDYYSFDKTAEVAKTFQTKNPEKIKFLQKNAQQSLIEMVHPFTSSQFIQLINLKEIKRHQQHLPAEYYQSWVEKMLVKAGVVSGNVIDNKKIIERLEKDREYFYHTIKKEIIEPLTHMEMRLKDNKEDENSLEVVKKVLGDIHLLLEHFDPAVFVDKTLFPNLSSVIEEFSSRSQITVSLSETGKEQRLDYITGISIMRVVREALYMIEKNRSASEIDFRIRWERKRLFIQIKDNSDKVFIRKLSQKSLSFMEERILLLNGEFRLKVKHDKGIMLLMTIPTEQESTAQSDGSS